MKTGGETGGVAGEAATIQPHGKCKYRHTLADAPLPDGTNIHHKLAKDGWRRWYRKYAPGDTVLSI